MTGLTGLEQRARELDVAVGEAIAEQEEKLRGTLEAPACVREAAPAATVLELARWAGADGPVARALSKSPTTSSSSGTPPRLSRSASVATADNDLDARVAEALRLLEDRDEPVARADFVDGLGFEDAEWTPLRQQLEADDRVDVSGNARGRRYALA
ncbi:MAG: hypothetical protein CVU56_16630 [Deltaproteobacteria bacterium HGW-Deltaproteobacteria-14]|nr:MAG: hypothetical protein CVU56_16630 [Deltaproteobacteria bacterium HGW-Deltaproteobacteria-14]